MDILLYLLTGAVAGISAGLLGIGGGLIIVPILFYLFSNQAVSNHLEIHDVMHMALATSLATIVVTSISSSYAHHKKQAILWHKVRTLTPGILLGAWLGVSLASQLQTEILKPIFAIFELLVAISLLVNLQTNAQIKINELLSGSFIGFISSIVGIGGGTLTVPILTLQKVKIKNAIATSAACGLPIALASTIAYIYTGSGQAFTDEWSLGYINLNAFFAIILTSVICAPLGAKLTHKLNEDLLRRIFAGLLVIISLKMMF